MISRRLPVIPVRHIFTLGVEINHFCFSFFSLPERTGILIQTENISAIANLTPEVRLPTAIKRFFYKLG